MIGQEWFYVQQVGEAYEIKAAKIIGETPRKWILREVEEIAREVSYPHDRRNAPGESRYDWSIPKKGDGLREGKGGLRGTSTRIFTRHSHIAEIMIKERLEAIWAQKNSYQIARLLETVGGKDPALLRKVAELIGYKEEAP